MPTLAAQEEGHYTQWETFQKITTVKMIGHTTGKNNNPLTGLTMINGVKRNNGKKIGDHNKGRETIPGEGFEHDPSSVHSNLL